MGIEKCRRTYLFCNSATSSCCSMKVQVQFLLDTLDKLCLSRPDLNLLPQIVRLSEDTDILGVMNLQNITRALILHLSEEYGVRLSRWKQTGRHRCLRIVKRCNYTLVLKSL